MFWIILGIGALWYLQKNPQILTATSDGIPNLANTIAPHGSRLNPRIMYEATFTVNYPPNTSNPLGNRGNNAPIRKFNYDQASGILQITLLLNNEGEAATALQGLTGALNATIVSTRAVNYYLLGNNWVHQDDEAAFIADCPRQQALNPLIVKCP